MQVNLQFMQPGNRSYSVAGLNNRFAQSKAAQYRVEDNRRQDRVTLSPQGKMMNMIENLQKQKKAIFEQRKELVARTHEEGGDLKLIQEQLDLYQEQAEAIDEQIAQLTTAMAKQAVEKPEQKKAKEPEGEQNSEELETEKLTRLANLSEGVKNTETVASVQRKLEGEIRVGESEVKLGALRIEALKEKEKDGANVHRMVKNAQKMLNREQEVVEKLETLSRSLEETQGQRMGETTEELEEEQQP